MPVEIREIRFISLNKQKKRRARQVTRKQSGRIGGGSKKQQDFYQLYLGPPPDLRKQQPGAGEVFPARGLKSGGPAAGRAQCYLMPKNKRRPGL